MGLPPWGGPPEVPGAPQGSPGVTELWKKLQKFPKIIWKLYMHQNTSNYNSDIHFRPPGLLGGSWEGQNGFLASPGGYLEARAPIFFLSVLYWPIEQDWGGPEARFWFHLFITAAYHCTMCTLGSFFSSRPSELRHIFKSQDCHTIQHIFVLTRSVWRKIEKIQFSRVSNSKFVIFPQIFPCSGHRAISYSPGATTGL